MNVSVTTSLEESCKVILFNQWNDNQYGVFSQDYKKTFSVGGLQYNCGEQFIEAKKAETFGDEYTKEQIMLSNNPTEIKTLGQTISNFDQFKWNELYYNFLVTANYNKFKQNKFIKNLLIQTGDKIIAYASPSNKILGIGVYLFQKDGTPNIHSYNKANWPHDAQNILGKVLMEVRSKIKSEED